MLSYKVRISCALVCPPTTTFGQLESTDFENRRISLHPIAHCGHYGIALTIARIAGMAGANARAISTIARSIPCIAQTIA